MCQRRRIGTVDFYRDWKDYELGFWNVDEEHLNLELELGTAQAVKPTVACAAVLF